MRQLPAPKTDDRLPPHDDNAELALLGCILEDNSYLEKIRAAGVDSLYLNSAVHQQIWGNFIRLASNKEPIDEVSYLKHFGKEHITLLGTARELCVTKHNYTYWIEILQEMLTRRRIIQYSAIATEHAYNTSLLPTEARIQVDHIISSLTTISKNGHARMAGPSVRSIFDLVKPDGEDPTELLKNRFLCRGKGILLVGPTGIGKSAFYIHCVISWALGRSAFGITPTRPLKSLLIQAENDDGDLIEMRDGVCAHLKLTPDEIEQVRKNVLIIEEDSRTKEALFAEVILPAMEENHPDILGLDPALCYLGGAVGSQEDVGHFLRNLLTPCLRKYNCGCIILHHTNKPPVGKEKNDWSGSDLSYLGSGSIEWANWSRGILAIRSIGKLHLFELVAPKRGSRLKWRHPVTSEPTFSKYIAHSQDQDLIYWLEVVPDAEDLKPEPSKRKTKLPDSKILDLMALPISQEDLADIAADEYECSRSLAQERIKALKDRKIIIHSSKDPDKLILNPYPP